MIKGGCLCGEVQFELKRHLQDRMVCYCSVCRKLSGSGLGAYGRIKKDQLVWLKGEQLLNVYQQNSNSQRRFCSVCGSYLLSTHRLAPDNYYISLGAIEDVDNSRLEYQQFVGSKVPWVTLAVDVEQYDAWPKWVMDFISKRHSP